MARFFVDTVDDNKYTIMGENAKHISKSLRMNIDETIILCDKDGFDYTCKITEINNDNVVVDVLNSEKNQHESDIKISLYMAFPKGDKFEFIVQKAVELGINRIVPVLTSRCISRPDKASFSKKLQRFNKISLEAAKQSGRGIVPQVLDIISFDEAINQMQTFDKKILFYENGGQPIKEVLTQSDTELAIFIGSEGGFSESEINLAISKGLCICSLGKRILRCETAPIVALSAIMLYTNNF